MKPLRTACRLVVFPAVLVALAAALGIRVRLAPASERNRRRAVLQQRACRILCRTVGVEVRPIGPVQDQAPCLAVCNHVGVLDGIILGAAMPTAFVAKAEMALWPVAGWVCRTVGVIFVERDRRMQTAGFVTEVQQRIRAGVTVTVFPEGTVGDEGRLLPFRTGAFESVAGQPDMAVLPMFMEATRAIRWHRHESMTRHTLRVLGHARSVVQVRFGTPIPTAELDRKDLARASRTAVAELGEIRSVGA